MGVLFEAGNDTIWTPSPRLARVFLAQIRGLEEITGVPSGVGEMVADEVQVEPELLKSFVTMLIEQMESTQNATMNSLIAGPLSIASGLLAAAGYSLPSAHGDVAALSRRGVALVSGRGMVGPIYEGLH